MTEQHDPVPPAVNPMLLNPEAYRQHIEVERQGYLTAATMMLYRNRAAVPLPYHYDVLTTARDFLRGGMFDVAVITAQTACEIATETVLSGLLRHHSLPADVESWIRKRIRRGSTFQSGALYDLYRALSGDDFKTTGLWANWNPLIAVRNNIIHQGSHATDAQAQQYCDLAEQIFRHFESILGRVTAPRA